MAAPDFQRAIVIHARHGIQRLERSMREIGEFVARFDDLARPRKCRVDVTDIRSDGFTGLVGCGTIRVEDLGRAAQLGLRTRPIPLEPGRAL